MNDTVKNILKFLFPEWQIVEAVKEEGFIAKKSKAKSKSLNRSSGVVQPSMAIGGHTAMKSEGVQSSGTAGTVAKSPQTKTYSATNSVKTDKVIEKFEGIEKDLRKKWVSDAESVEMLSQAFKRPYVMGYDNNRPRNAIMLIGGNSRGKMLSITLMAQALKEKKVLSYSEASCLDLKKYTTNAEENLFLSDLYKALYDPTDIVVFENIESGFYIYRDLIAQLLAKGKIVLNKRYVIQSNILVEATGTLNTNSISEVSANGKYFVFTTCMKEEKVVELLGQTFIKFVNDIITLKDFTEIEVFEIVNRRIADFIAKCKKQLQIDIDIDETAKREIAEHYTPAKGVNGIVGYIEEEIYKPLTEYRLKKPAVQTEEAILIYDNGLVARFGEKEIALSGLVKNYNESALEKVKEELHEVIGLKTVKEYVLGLENNLKVQQLRESKGLKTSGISMHMIFTGNPGTGKTTIARIVSKYLKAIGVLSSGQLIEVSRTDLVGQYMGHTATLTTAVIKSALGGVLFIDEAYSLCRDKNDVFGLEAIDALVKGMEDNRDDLIVILAGYDNEMAEFLKSNTGLKSRFPNIIHFDDYTPEEMFEIANITVKGKGYKIAEDCKKSMLDEFEKKQIKGRNDAGNGRLVRNIIESAILKQSQRISMDNSVDLEMLTAEDFGYGQRKEFELEKELDVIIGLGNVKDFIRTQYHLILAKEKRRKANLQVDTTQTLNMIFAGNPGTGKTTIARVVAEMFHEMGVLKSGHLVETDKGGLVAEYVGQTAKKTEEVFKSALGGVLFIDEAYAITNDGSSFGQECIDTLVKLIEDYRGETLVILAGYSKEMKDFMKANSGLESRFPLQIEFPDYSAEELYAIGLKMIDDKGFALTESSMEMFKEEVYNLKKRATATSGNGRMVRNYIDEMVRNQSSRIALQDVNNEEMNIILPCDIKNDAKHTQQYNLEEDLSKVIGLDEVKKYIRGLSARLRVQEERKKAGLKADNTQTMHMIFKGNPGTGKTMMARTVANVLANMGVIRTNKMVETDRSGLVAGYVGQTALKTRQVIESALDGVLFIDEAYSLAQGGSNDFGKEAIDTLVKMMDDNRDRLVVILAGYSDDMENFLNKNAGLKSRFPNMIEFADYATDELLAIADNLYVGQGYILSQEAKACLMKKFEAAKSEPQFGNGRYVRNVYEKSLNNQALRLSSDDDLSKEDLTVIAYDDVKEV